MSFSFAFWVRGEVLTSDVTVECCADIIESMSGTRPSDGWVHGLLERAARAVAEGWPA